MAKSRQTAEGIRVRGNFGQTSDVASTEQKATDVEADSARQTIQSKQTGLYLGKYRAVGLAGIIGLVIVAMGWFALKYLLS